VWSRVVVGEVPHFVPLAKVTALHFPWLIFLLSTCNFYTSIKYSFHSRFITTFEYTLMKVTIHWIPPLYTPRRCWIDIPAWRSPATWLNDALRVSLILSTMEWWWDLVELWYERTPHLELLIQSNFMTSIRLFSNEYEETDWNLIVILYAATTCWKPAWT
jgi:hypothetical protein